MTRIEQLIAAKQQYIDDMVKESQLYIKKVDLVLNALNKGGHTFLDIKVPVYFLGIHIFNRSYVLYAEPEEYSDKLLVRRTYFKGLHLSKPISLFYSTSSERKQILDFLTMEML